MIIAPKDLSELLRAAHTSPHSVLGMHPVTKGRNKGVVVRALLRQATRCDVVDLADGQHWPLERIAPEGLYEVLLPKRTEVFRYQLRVTNASGEMRQFYDPYSFLPTLGDQDLYLFNEGNEHRVYDKLGAHVRTIDGVNGVAFAVWAPAAKQVSLVGNFNHWDGRFHQMRPLGSSGVWELFVPGLEEGEVYKFAVRDSRDHVRLKTDPYGTYFEGPPNNASIVYDATKFKWNDGEWMEKRRANAGQLDQPMSIYEVHLGSWRRKPEDAARPLDYREAAEALATYALEMGFTHIEFMPLAEHPFSGSWGYQVTGFYAPTHRYGTPEDFAWMVDYLHQRGLGVILDWVPAHFPRDSFALAEFDGSHLYEHADPRLGAHMDWGTLIFNYGRNEVRCFLVANALAWLDRYHIDGLRVDAVASMLYLDYSRKEGQWIPNKYGGRENLEAIDFLKRVNDLVHQYHPGAVTIAEESTSFPGVTQPTKDGGLGFDYKWNMGWMHDTLRYFSKEPIHRKWHQNDLTFGMLYQYAEKFVTVFSHDEVVHGKGSMLFKMGAWHIPQKAANLRSLYAHMWAYPGKKLLFMGCEFAQSHEWNYTTSLDWHLCQYSDHEGVRLLVRDLNRLYVREPVLSRTDFNPQSFRWISCQDADASVLAYLRTDAEERTLFVVVGHFSGANRTYRIGVPHAGLWREVVNTDSEFYGGSGQGNAGARHTEEVPHDGYNQSLELSLPATSTLVLKWFRQNSLAMTCIRASGEFSGRVHFTLRMNRISPAGAPISAWRAVRFWLAFLLPCAGATQAALARAPELEAVLKTFRVDGPKGWSFTQSTEGDGHSRVERFNAALPEFQRWTLLQQDGRAPTTAELKDYNEKQTRRSRGGSAPPLTDMLDLTTAERVEHTAERSTYRCRLKPGEKDDRTGKHLVTLITLHHPTNSIESFTLEAIEAFSPAMGVKVAEMRTTVSYTLPSGDRPSLLNKITTHLRGRAFLVKSLDADLTVTFTDYEKAHR